MLGHMDISIIEYPKYHWHVAFGHKRLCYERATAGTFILNLLYMSGSETPEPFELQRKLFTIFNELSAELEIFQTYDKISWYSQKL